MRIIFLGRRPHAVDALTWLLNQGHEVVRVVAPSGEGAETEYWSPSLREMALCADLPVSSVQQLYADLAGDPERHNLHDIDLAVSFLFWKRIRRPLIECARFGCINFHPAPLPEYQGLGGFNFAILHKLSEWGATAHYVDDTFDTGPIIRVERFPFDWRTATAFTLERATRQAILQCFKQTIRDVERFGKLPTTPNVGGTYYDRAAFEREKRIDLGSMSTEEVDLRARAFWFPPYDGAYIERGGQRSTLVTQDILSQLSVLHQETQMPSGTAQSFDAPLAQDSRRD